MTSTDGGYDFEGDDERQLRSTRRWDSILDVVRRYGRPLSLSELEEALVERAAASTPRFVDGDPGDELGIRLHHVHLLDLARSGTIEYDASRRIVRPRRGDSSTSFDRADR